MNTPVNASEPELVLKEEKQGIYSLKITPAFLAASNPKDPHAFAERMQAVKDTIIGALPKLHPAIVPVEGRIMPNGIQETVMKTKLETKVVLDLSPSNSSIFVNQRDFIAMLTAVTDKLKRHEPKVQFYVVGVPEKSQLESQIRRTNNMPTIAPDIMAVSKRSEPSGGIAI